MTRFKLGVTLLAFVMAALFAPAGYAEGISRVKPPSSFAEPPISKEWSWAGVYLDIGAGGQAAIVDLSARSFGEEGQTTSSAALNGLGAWDWVGNARVGFNLQPSGSPFVFGVFAGYSLGSVEIDGNINGSGFAAEITPTWDVGALVGLVGPNKSLLYAGYKYQMADFDLRGTGGAAEGFAEACSTQLRCSDDLTGHGLIAGFKMPVTPAFVLGIEYGYTRFDDIELSRIDGTSFRLEPEVHTVMLRGSVLVGPNLFGN